MVYLDPNVSFKPTVESKFGKANIIVVKDAKGAMPIRRWYKDWRPDKGEKPKGNGDLYDRLMEKVNSAIKGEKIATVTFIWMQGENDAAGKHGDVYATSLRGLIKQLANDLNRDDINVVIGRINDFGMSKKSHPDWNKIREAQVSVAESLPSATWVDTDDLNADGSHNAIHATKEGYKTLGKRFAEAAIGLIKK
jgi:hypothetical protein